jgi:TonB family protein
MRLLLCFLLIQLVAFSQELETSEKLNLDTKKRDSISNSVVTFWEPEAEFPGGHEALSQYVLENCEYPTDALKDSISGRVIVQAIIEKDGSITEVKVRKSLHPLLDAEALQLVKNMPNFIPACAGNECYRERISLPIQFICCED